MKRLGFTVVVLALASAILPAAREDQIRTVYVSAVDRSGAPVAGLTASDIVIKENSRTILPSQFGPAAAPMRIAIVVDDGDRGLPEVRDGLSAFVRAVQGRANVGLFSTARAANTVVNFTTDQGALAQGIDGLVPRPGGIQTGAALSMPENRFAGGLNLRDMTLELAYGFSRQPQARSVVLVLTITSDAQHLPASLASPLGTNCKPENPGGSYAEPPTAAFRAVRPSRAVRPGR